MLQTDQSIYAKTEDIYKNGYQVLMGTVNPELVRNDSIYTFANANSRFSIHKNGDIGNYASWGNPTAFDGRSILFSGGFFLAGVSEGNLWVNGVAVSSRVEDYISGTAGGSESKLFVVRKSDLPFTSSWLNWSEAVALGANFYDGNGDGIYNPVDLNGNGIWDKNEDSPDILGDETVWCVYNDGVPSAVRNFTDIEPQGIDIRQTVWTYLNDENLKNIYFVRYSILNTGTIVDDVDSVYCGLWSDPDIGDSNDDFTGCDSLLNSGYCYDDSASCDSLLNSGYCYDDPYDQYFGSNSPTAFHTLLQGPWKYVNDTTQVAFNNKGDIIGIDTIQGAINLKGNLFNVYCRMQDPDNSQQAMFYLLGRDLNGSVIDPCDTAYGIVYDADCSTINGKWAYSGDPVNLIGWLDNHGCDKRIMLNTGPFQLEAGNPIDIITAYHFERGQTNLESITLGKEKATYLLQNFLVSVDDDNSRENIVTDYKLYQNYPNPFNPSTKIRWQSPVSSRQVLKVFDVLGNEIATLVNEYKPTGSYEIEFDASRLSSGIYFYQLRAGKFFSTKKMILIK
jgi:hypothetical protein